MERVASKLINATRGRGLRGLHEGEFQTDLIVVCDKGCSHPIPKGTPFL